MNENVQMGKLINTATLCLSMCLEQLYMPLLKFQYSQQIWVAMLASSPAAQPILFEESCSANSDFADICRKHYYHHYYNVFHKGSKLVEQLTKC